MEQGAGWQKDVAPPDPESRPKGLPRSGVVTLPTETAPGFDITEHAGGLPAPEPPTLRVEHAIDKPPTPVEESVGGHTDVAGGDTDATSTTVPAPTWGAHEIRECIHRHSRLRFPDIRGMHGRERIVALEDHMVATAIAVGELSEARLWAQEALSLLQDEWDDLQGWQTALPSRGARGNTQADVTEAKRAMRPDLYRGIQESKRLVARLTEQIERLGGFGEEQVASRVYSMSVGG